MRKIVFIMLLFFSSYQVNYAQEILSSLKKSDIFEFNNSDYQIVSKLKVKNNIYLLTQNSKLFRTTKSYTLIQLNENLDKISQIEIPAESEKFIHLYTKNDTLYLLTVQENFLKNRFEFILRTQLGSQNIKAHTIHVVETSNFRFNLERDDFKWGLAISNNKDYITIFQDFNEKLERFFTITFKYDGTLFKERQVISELKDRNVIIRGVEVDAQGNVYVLGKEFRALETKVDNKKTNTFVLFSNKGNLKINTEDKYLNDLSVVNLSDKLYILGLYAEKRSSKGFNGIYFSEVDLNKMQMIKTVFNDFTEDYLKDKVTHSNETIRKLKLDFLLKNFDGLYLIGEERYVSKMKASFTDPNTLATYNHNDISIFKIGLDGSILWSRSIYKRQKTTMKNVIDFNSYTLFQENDKLYVTFNAADKVKKNKSGLPIYKSTSPKKYNLMLGEIDSKGKIAFQKILNNNDSETTAVPNVASRFLNNILISRRLKKYQVYQMNVN